MTDYTNDINRLQNQINAIKDEIDVVYATLERLSEKREENVGEDKIVMYATANDGDGHVQRIGVYESIEDIEIHTGMFNNVEITFEYDNTRSKECD